MKNETTESVALKRNKPCYAVYQDIADEKKFIVPEGSTITVMLPSGPDGPAPVGGYSFDKVPTQWLLIPMDKKKVLYDGRYVAVSGYVYSFIRGKWCVLANKRGEGAPDYKHCWNVVCGFLEACEDAKTGTLREIKEETGYVIPKKLLKFMSVETDPVVCNNGNVTIRFSAIVDSKSLKRVNAEGGEIDEVEDCKWIPIKELDDYPWAFNHRWLIPEIFKQIPWWRKLWWRINTISM